MSIDFPSEFVATECDTSFAKVLFLPSAIQIPFLWHVECGKQKIWRFGIKSNHIKQKQRNGWVDVSKRWKRKCKTEWNAPTDWQWGIRVIESRPPSRWGWMPLASARVTGCQETQPSAGLRSLKMIQKPSFHTVLVIDPVDQVVEDQTILSCTRPSSGSGSTFSGLGRQPLCSYTAVDSETRHQRSPWMKHTGRVRHRSSE